MAREDIFIVLVHHKGSIKRKTRSGVKFTDKDSVCIIVSSTTTYVDLARSVLLKLGLDGHVSLSTAVSRSADTGAVGKAVPAYEPPAPPVASHSFAVDLNGSVGDEVGTAELLPTSVHCAARAGAGDGLFNDLEDDDVEPDMIADDSGDDIGASELAGAGGGSSSGKQQYPPYFSSLDLEAMRQAGVPGEPAGFGARDAEGSTGMAEFQFGNGCTWLIRLSLPQRKGIWEVKRYNGPHTCLASSISSDHRSLDYHVISIFIMPMVRADASVSIKVLLNATASYYGFRPTYRRVWMAKQKAVALIYGDWDESYNEIPRWVLGVQLTMPGSIAVLRTSPVCVGGQLNKSQAYFHRLFWTFPPCIEAFCHCKPLVSIDGTHLYGKYGGYSACCDCTGRELQYTPCCIRTSRG
ncbi:uncharacterized protein LOC107460749 [Arachis duranensis]|uniref:Uncharacterized protein LOC107460749 n=1 Tax=Arachis duranensis TaxID=130453 RepID=A0A6P4C0G9_ARADU|nr:uncharacterized protein LOC107460749 [Arachis duranensis]